jgi:hypothetical protein
LFLSADPVLDRSAPIEHFSPNPGARRAKLAGLPSGEGIAGKPEFTGQLFAADPVGQKVQRFILRGRYRGLHIKLLSRTRQMPDSETAKQMVRGGT